MKKIRVFLGGLVNCVNAQNLNCLALAEHLDKSKYEVMTMVSYSGSLPIINFPNVQYIKIHYHPRIWMPICLAWGLLWSDIAYLPKPENWKLCLFLLKLFRKKTFKTVEGAFIGTNLTKCLEAGMTNADICHFLGFTGHAYSITKHMRSVNENVLGLKTEDKILYLGVDSGKFGNTVSRTKLTDIAMIGSNLFYKGIEDFFELSTRFPNLRFHVIGSGMGMIDPEEEVQKRGLQNVVCHGSESHEQLKESLKNIQLHIFPSRAEGFPKVTLETAAAGVPSIVYGDYGADEWITTGKDGFVVNTLNEMASVIADLQKHPEKLQPLADNAKKLAQSFDWKVLIKDWEEVIDELAKK